MIECLALDDGYREYGGLELRIWCRISPRLVERSVLGEAPQPGKCRIYERSND